MHAPYGMAGGADGARGLNLLQRADGRRINLGGKNTVAVTAGDRLVLHTPGGGGYGAEAAISDASGAAAPPPPARVPALSDRGSVAEYTRLQESSA